MKIILGIRLRCCFNTLRMLSGLFLFGLIYSSCEPAMLPSFDEMTAEQQQNYMRNNNFIDVSQARAFYNDRTSAAFCMP